MAHTTLRHCGTALRSMLVSRPITPTPTPTARPPTPQALQVPIRGLAGVVRKTAKGKVDCSCAGHPWPVKPEDIKVLPKKKDCSFDFRKLEVNPYDIPCDCKDPPPAAGCRDLGRPKEVCCRTIRQYGCYCEELEEEEEESCEEEGEVESYLDRKTCALDFRKLEVDPYDDPCDCRDPPLPNSCESLATKSDVCCRTPKPFGCDCKAYDEPAGLECVKQKSPPTQAQARAQKEDCNKKQFKAKCL